MREVDLPKGWERVVFKPKLEVFRKGKIEVSIEKFNSVWILHGDKGNKTLIHSKHNMKSTANKRALFFMKRVK